MLTLETSRELMARAQAGDADAFGEIYRRHRSDIHGYIMRRHPRHAEDLTSEVFTRALRALPRWQDKGKPVAWLMTIAGNLCIEHARTAYQRTTHLDPDAGVDRADLPERTNPGVMVPDTVDQAVTLNALVAAVSQLTHDQREVVILHHLQELTIAESARVMGRNLSATKTLLYRARHALGRNMPERTAL